MMRIILTIVLFLGTVLSCGAEEEVFRIAPDLADTDLKGPVKKVMTETSINVSGAFTRTQQGYNRDGYLINETEWDAEGERINTLTNYYDEDGVFLSQLYMDFEEGFTNDWEILIKPDTRQLAKRKADGTAAVFTYNADGYGVGYRFLDAEHKMSRGSRTKRDENNRRLEYVRLDERGRPVYTYWFRWEGDSRLMDRERQKYWQEDGERLHTYEYIDKDYRDNWTQRMMVRYDIGGKKKEKVYHRLVTRTISYYTDGTTPFSSLEDTTGTVSQDVSGADLAASSTESNEVGIAAGEEVELQDEEEYISYVIDYTFDEISDKVVIITCTTQDGGRSYGSGFVARMDGKTYLFTNQHVIMGSRSFTLKTADGTTLKPLGVELSVTRDIARIRIEDRNAFEVGSKIYLGMQIGVFGNSEGEGVATELLGEVTDFGTDLVEVSAEFVPGNSGSPVLNPMQQVIGIASFARFYVDPDEEDEEDTEAEEDEDDEGTVKVKTRRFCYRLTDLQWKPVKWISYNKKYGALYRDSEALADNLYELINRWDDDWLQQIPLRSDMASDLAGWVKEHNQLIGRYERRQVKARSFINAYADNLDELADTCRARARRVDMFANQKELTGFLADTLSSQAEGIEFMSLVLRYLAEYLREMDT